MLACGLRVRSERSCSIWRGWACARRDKARESARPAERSYRRIYKAFYMVKSAYETMGLRGRVGGPGRGEVGAGHMRGMETRTRQTEA
jgi:hypothetical protein